MSFDHISEFEFWWGHLNAIVCHSYFRFCDNNLIQTLARCLPSSVIFVDRSSSRWRGKKTPHPPPFAIFIPVLTRCQESSENPRREPWSPWVTLCFSLSLGFCVPCASPKMDCFLLMVAHLLSYFRSHAGVCNFTHSFLQTESAPNVWLGQLCVSFSLAFEEPWHSKNESRVFRWGTG